LTGWQALQCQAKHPRPRRRLEIGVWFNHAGSATANQFSVNGDDRKKHEKKGRLTQHDWRGLESIQLVNYSIDWYIRNLSEGIDHHERGKKKENRKKKENERCSS
jgi:hypothetical protein